ncbi:MAG: hypothetical protein HYR80_04880 [Nitrospirae bacterium]|nr:hypothetical protein [Nitrospirota bacterium]
MKNILPVVFCYSLLILGAGHSAQAEKIRSEISTGLDLKYVDNVISIIDSNGNSLEREPDFIYEPYLVFRLKIKDPVYSQKVAVTFSYDGYIDHSVLDYPSYALLFEQGMGENTFLTLKYSLIPYLIVGDEDPTNANTSNPIDSGLNYRLQNFTVSIDRDLNRQLNVYLYGREMLKDYNIPLAYRTAIANKFGGDVTYYVSRQTLLLLGISYEINESQKGTPVGSAIPYLDDTDYTSPGFSILGLRHLNSKNIFRLKYLFKLRNYATSDPSELLHFARNDRIHDILISNTFKFNSQWSWKSSYENFRRDSDHSYADYTENSLTIGIDYLF